MELLPKCSNPYKDYHQLRSSSTSLISKRVQEGPLHAPAKISKSQFHCAFMLEAVEYSSSYKRFVNWSVMVFFNY